MLSNHVILVLFCGGIWKSLSTEVPPNVSRTESTVPTSTGSPAAGRAPTQRLPAAGPALQERGTATAGPTPQLPALHIEPTNGSRVAAMVMGIVLGSMVVAISLIILWKCRRRPSQADTNWAGRSPFADGDTPDVFTDSGQVTKRSSILSMLPWKLREDTQVLHDPSPPEEPPGCTASTNGQQLPPAAGACPAACTAAAPAPGPGPSPAESPELPPPPAWLQEPAAAPEELPSEIQEPFPPPPEAAVEEMHKAPAQPEHPL